MLISAFRVYLNMAILLTSGLGKTYSNCLFILKENIVKQQNNKFENEISFFFKILSDLHCFLNDPRRSDQTIDFNSIARLKWLVWYKVTVNVRGPICLLIGSPTVITHLQIILKHVCIVIHLYLEIVKYSVEQANKQKSNFWEGCK